MKKLLVNTEICAGCRACEMACSGVHYQKYSPELSRIRIVKLEEKGVDVPTTCKQCSAAPCIESCPVDALYKDGRTGATRLDQDKCIGCGLCVKACPFAAARLDEQGLVMICDLCGGAPQCVEVCPVDALLYGEVNKVAQKKRVELAEKKAKSVMKMWEIN